MNADALLQVADKVTDMTVRIAVVWAMLGVGVFFLTGAVLNLDEWRERKRENARYRRC